MQILLIDSYGLNDSIAEQVIEILSKTEGKWNFIKGKKEELPNYPITIVINTPTRWEIFFERLKKYRDSNNIPADVFILMFTEEQNESNWFGVYDLERKNQGFVQASYWEELVRSESIYPIVYQAVAIPLQARMFGNMDEDPWKYIHKKTRGCINDFCEDKKEVMLKLQTGNICTDCYDRMIKSGVTEQELDHIDSLLDNIRLKFREFNLRRKKRKPLPLIVRNDGLKIYIGDAILKLRPLDKALYLFYLNNSISIRTKDLPDYENKLLEYYGPLFTGSSRDDMVRNVGRLARNEDGITNQAVSRVNRAIDKLVIEELANHYKILTELDGYKSVKAEVFKLDKP
jgi:hypothetical protein